MDISGARLAGDYYQAVVAPLLRGRWPALPHAAARLGSGSDVLGWDDEVSRDHDWGLRLTLLVPAGLVDVVDAFLAQALPETHRGLPTRFCTTWRPDLSHQVEVATAESFAASRLGIPVDRAWDAIDWLSLTGQSVLEVTGGAVFADTLGALSDIRRRLSWYPDDVWRYVVAVDWQRIGQELSFVGRAGARGDELGSRVLTGHLVGIAMHLAFLLHRQWPPYSKWFGTGFGELPVAATLATECATAVAACRWPERQTALGRVLEVLHEEQRASGLPSGPALLVPLADRPFLTLRGSVTESLLAAVADPLVRRLPTGVGSVEQWVDNADVLSHPERRVAVMRTWRYMLLGDV